MPTERRREQAWSALPERSQIPNTPMSAGARIKPELTNYDFDVRTILEGKNIPWSEDCNRLMREYACKIKLQKPIEAKRLRDFIRENGLCGHSQEVDDRLRARVQNKFSQQLHLIAAQGLITIRKSNQWNKWRVEWPYHLEGWDGTFDAALAQSTHVLPDASSSVVPVRPPKPRVNQNVLASLPPSSSGPDTAKESAVASNSPCNTQALFKMKHREYASENLLLRTERQVERLKEELASSNRCMY